MNNIKSRQINLSDSSEIPSVIDCDGFILGQCDHQDGFYLYVMRPEVAKRIHTVTVVSTILPATVIFYRYTIDLASKQNELKHLKNTDVLTQVINRRVPFEEGE